MSTPEQLRGAEMAPTLLPCPFCSETEHLEVAQEYFEHVVQTESGDVMLDEEGEPKIEMIDAIECRTCGAVAPIHVWDARPNAISPIMRAGYIAYAFPPEPQESAK